MRPFLLIALVSASSLAFSPVARAADSPSAMPMPGNDFAELVNTGPFGPKESNTDYFWRKSDEAFHQGDYDRAILLHKAIVASDPGDVQSYGVCAWLMWSMGHGDEAVAHLKRGLAANPDSFEMWETVGQQYDLMKKLPEAKDAYVQAVRLMPKDNADAQMLRRQLAHAAERAGDNSLAVATWQGLVNDFPSEAVNKNNLDRVQRQSKDATMKQMMVPLAIGGTALLQLASVRRARTSESA